MLFVFFLLASLFLNEILTFFRFDTSLRVDSLGIRGTLNLIALQFISESPIFGYGYNTTALLLDTHPIVQETGRDFHNYYLTKILELGLYGFVINLSFFVYLLTQFKQKDSFSVGIGAAFIGMLFINLFNGTLPNVYVYVPMVLFYAISLISLKKC
jgi:O-antigen ligase